MNQNISVEFKNVSKEYKLSKKASNKIASLLLHEKKLNKKKVLDNISFKIKKGETVAILGKNGMGKSTIIKLLSRITYPTSGEVITNGLLRSIIELDAGFENEFSGRENIYLKCRILGLKKEEVDLIIEDIIEFTDIGEYIDQPVRSYSSGMRARLGFSIISHIKSDILAVDEVFSVGDFKFREKCQKKITEIKNDEKITFILVTHSCEMAKEFCSRGLLLDNGKILFDGDIDTCIEKYLKL